MRAAAPLLVMALGLAPACAPDDPLRARTAAGAGSPDDSAVQGRTPAAGLTTAGEGAPSFPRDDPGTFVTFGEQGVRRVRSGVTERVVAYVSRERQEIYIHPDFRDRTQNLLNAHISVSTGHWRIHLPGDSSSEPLTPGVPEREFEEMELAAWDSRRTPAEGDFRILLGSAGTETLFLTCEPIAGSSERFRSRATGFRTISAGREGVGREDFVRLMDVERLDPDCAPMGDSLSFWGWIATGR